MVSKVSSFKLTPKKRRSFHKANQVCLHSYASCLLQLTLPPLARHGICLEAHGQNMVARFCRETGALRGFAIRDFGGLRLHMPSLGSYGHQLDDIFPGSAIKTNNLHDVWSKAHHTLIQTHLGQLVTALQLESQGGWAIVREQLCQILRSDDLSNGRDLCDFFMQDTMPFKCFIKMKLEGKYRDVSVLSSCNVRSRSAY